MILQFLQDTQHENVAIFIDGQNVIDYDDYVNFECALHIFKYLGNEFTVQFYDFNSEEIEDWDGFPQILDEMMEHLALNENATEIYNQHM